MEAELETLQVHNMQYLSEMGEDTQERRRRGCQFSDWSDSRGSFAIDVPAHIVLRTESVPGLQERESQAARLGPRGE